MNIPSMECDNRTVRHSVAEDRVRKLTLRLRDSLPNRQLLWAPETSIPAWALLGWANRTPAFLKEPTLARALGFPFCETLSHFLSSALTFEPSFSLLWRSDSLLKCWVTMNIKDGR